MQSAGVGAGYPSGSGVSMTKTPDFQCSSSLTAGAESPTTRITLPGVGTTAGILRAEMPEAGIELCMTFVANFCICNYNKTD